MRGEDYLRNHGSKIPGFLLTRHESAYDKTAEMEVMAEEYDRMNRKNERNDYIYDVDGRTDIRSSGKHYKKRIGKHGGGIIAERDDYLVIGSDNTITGLYGKRGQGAQDFIDEYERNRKFREDTVDYGSWGDEDYEERRLKGLEEGLDPRTLKQQSLDVVVKSLVNNAYKKPTETDESWGVPRVLQHEGNVSGADEVGRILSTKAIRDEIPAVVNRLNRSEIIKLDDNRHGYVFNFGIMRGERISGLFKAFANGFTLDDLKEKSFVRAMFKNLMVVFGYPDVTTYEVDGEAAKVVCSKRQIPFGSDSWMSSRAEGVSRIVLQCLNKADSAAVRLARNQFMKSLIMEVAKDESISDEKCTEFLEAVSSRIGFGGYVYENVDGQLEYSEDANLRFERLHCTSEDFSERFTKLSKITMTENRCESGAEPILKVTAPGSGASKNKRKNKKKKKPTPDASAHLVEIVPANQHAPSPSDLVAISGNRVVMPVSKTSSTPDVLDAPSTKPNKPQKMISGSLSKSSGPQREKSRGPAEVLQRN